MDLYAFRLSDGAGVVVIFDDPTGRLLDRQQVWHRLAGDAQSARIDHIVAHNEVAPLRAELQALEPQMDIDARRPVLGVNILRDPLVSGDHRGTFAYRDTFPMIVATEASFRLRVDAAYDLVNADDRLDPH